MRGQQSKGIDDRFTTAQVFSATSGQRPNARIEWTEWPIPYVIHGSHAPGRLLGGRSSFFPVQILILCPWKPDHARDNYKTATGAIFRSLELPWEKL
jgi:hypothetical protein